MSVLNRIAHFQNRRDEVPNQELARDLAEGKDRNGIQEIAENLWNKEKRIQADCIKVLYEIGYIDPTLIAEYVGDFLKLLYSRNNRMVWGGMTALSTIAALQAEAIFDQLREVQAAVEAGSVITRDAGVLTLSKIAATRDEYRRVIFPYLLDKLRGCRPKEVAQYAEKSLLAVDSSNQTDFIAVIENRMEDLTDSQIKRVKKVLQAASAA
jgi:hypothetical protein